MEDFYRLLAREARSEACLRFDACPLDGLLVNIDGYGEEESRFPWMRLEDWGWKAVVSALSDVEASGGRPLGVMISLGVRSVEEAVLVVRGAREASAWAGVGIYKSDTNRAEKRWIDVAVVGRSERPIPRDGAREGDLVVQVGLAGYGLVAGLVLEGRLGLGDVPGDVLLYTRRPHPPLGAGAAASSCGASAGMDNSDGMGYTLKTIADMSGVRIEVDRVAAPRSVSELASRLGLSPEDLLRSWEDYNLVYTGDRRAVDCILSWCSKARVHCEVIGRVTRGSGVYLGGRSVEVEGWSWF